MIRISKSTARKLNPLKNIVYAAIKENIRIKINKERFSRNCFLSSLNDHDFFLNLISPISLKKIVHEMVDIGTDIYQASLHGRSITERE